MRGENAITTNALVEVEFVVKGQVLDAVPEYIPPYSKPENYDPGTPAEFRITSVRLEGSDVELVDLLDSEVLAQIEEQVLEQ